MCPCGEPAKAALITMLGDVPTCQPPEVLRARVVEAQAFARGDYRSRTQ
jgi:hypothetical protein